MSVQKDLVTTYVEKMLADAREQNIPTDLIGRELINEAIRIYQMERSVEDIAQELSFVAENLDPDTEFTFMRP